MRRDLIRRLERLENYLENASKPVVRLAWVCHRIEDARRDALAANERIVYDVYRQGGVFRWARERITMDPADEGRECPPQGFLEDVIQELHQKCERREPGGCRDCRGLEHLFAPPVPMTLHNPVP